MKTHGKLTKAQRRKVLVRMRELLAHPRGFTRGNLYTVRRSKKLRETFGTTSAARVLRTGGTVEPGDFGFCLLGACEIAMREVVPGWFDDACCEDGYSLAVTKYGPNGTPLPPVVDQLSILTLAKARGHDSIPSFNDDERTTKKDILDVLDERIAAHEAKAQA